MSEDIVGAAAYISPVAQYWKHVAAGRFAVQECGACGQRFFPPQRCCHSCGEADLGWRFPAPEDLVGYLYSFTVVHKPPAPQFADETPYVIGIGALEAISEDTRLYARLVDVAEPDALHVGMGVRVTLQPVAGSVLPVLQPVSRQP